VERKICTVNAAALTCVILLMFRPAMAGEVLLQPRLETGEAYYSFESEAMNITKISKPLPGQLGSNFTQKAFEYSGYMSFIGAGATLFVNRFFLDLCGQYASGGHDTTLITYSGYVSDSNGFIAADASHTASFDRSDAAVSLGYAFTRQFNLFAGYKWATSKFSTTFEGRYSLVNYNFGDEEDHAAGRNWGEVDYKFEYKGPFVGAIHSWDCSHCRFIKGMFTANLALAHLEGDVVLKKQDQHWTINSINGQPVPEAIIQFESGISARVNTQGDTWGLTFGVGWRGATALEGLSYALGISGYRYEFDAEENNQSDIKETALIYKVGLAYVF
jgi:hypothetical protein